MHLPRTLSWALIFATWTAAVVLFVGDMTIGRVVAVSFFAAKGMAILLTLLALLRNRRIAWQIFCGRYRFDTHRQHGLSQALTRFTWELPQLFIGYAIAQIRLLLGNVDRVDTLDGVTFVTSCHRREHAYTGMSMGCYVQMWLPVEIQTDFEHYARHHAGRMLLHEYGHTLDSQLWGWLYLPVIGLPSLVSQWLELAGFLHHRHDNLYAERWANRHADNHFYPR